MRTLLPGLATTALTAVLTTAVLTAPAQAEAAVLHAGSPTAVPGSYIVKTESGRADVATRLGDRVTRSLDAFGGFTATLTPRQARRLAADPAVEYVEQDQVVHANATQTNAPWGLDRIDQRPLPPSTTYSWTSVGAGVTAYVVDTGIRTTHREFAGRASHCYDAVDNDSVAQDDNGHGTHVAGVIAGSTYGVAKGARVCGVRVLGANGSGTIAGVIAGVNWVTQNAVRPAVANFSLGGGASTALDDAVRRMIAAGITASVTAGGSNTTVANTSPARVVEALTSGATNQADARAPFSNHGAGVDLYAPGVGITSAWHTGDTAVNTLSGTSMATGFVSGVAVRHLQGTPTATPAQVHAEIVREATPLPWGGRLLHWSPAR
ncbi:S8 family peptidase [Saccharothrix yanglingensis]|uniref:Peptidase S8 n=1 Tax=Saccharothrix yanglingensis TaxID=659496 RepID=A0ABU0X148_9PSEU|nr:S8 family peptidase [Saccharothrix yanglingensis]MDQ2584299.1 peptidase S8 [Saccharothrix yanglingensis]